MIRPLHRCAGVGPKTDRFMFGHITILNTLMRSLCILNSHFAPSLRKHLVHGFKTILLNTEGPTIASVQNIRHRRRIVTINIAHRLQ